MASDDQLHFLMDEDMQNENDQNEQNDENEERSEESSEEWVDIEPPVNPDNLPIAMPDFANCELTAELHMGLLYLMIQANEKLKENKKKDNLRQVCILRRVIKKIVDASEAFDAEVERRIEAINKAANADLKEGEEEALVESHSADL